jgi:hypothetical protein
MLYPDIGRRERCHEDIPWGHSMSMLRSRRFEQGCSRRSVLAVRIFSLTRSFNSLK